MKKRLHSTLEEARNQGERGHIQVALLLLLRECGHGGFAYTMEACAEVCHGKHLVYEEMQEAQFRWFVIFFPFLALRDMFSGTCFVVWSYVSKRETFCYIFSDHLEY